MTTGLVTELCADFAAEYGDGDAIQFAFAPGRVNLIGEHTDYNDGFVLPMAIDRYVGVAFRPGAQHRICAYAPDYQERRCLPLDQLDSERPRGWFGYVAGVLWALQQRGYPLRGMEIVVRGRVPIGAGLSSSAALEMAVARAAAENAGFAWNPAEMALLGQKAERDYVGVSCGIMDQFTSAMAADGCALLLDCRSLEVELVGVPPNAVFVVMDTGVRRSLARSAYNERYGQCQAAVRVMSDSRPDVRALRDVTSELLETFRAAMDPVTFRRARHVVEENLRPAQLAAALHAGDLREAGRLMGASHRSLRDLYEVSSPELDAMVELATDHADCHGARLTGAGFGGCAIALVDREGLTRFTDAVTAAYRARFDHPAELFACEASPGARILPAASGGVDHP